MSLFVGEAPILADATTVQQIAGTGNFRIQIEEFAIAINLAAASTANQDLWITPPGQIWQVSAVDVTFGTTSTSGTVTIQKCTGTTAAGSGTALLTAPVSLSGTANTPLGGVLISGPLATLQLQGGPLSAPTRDRLALVLAGTLTGLADCLLQVRMKRVG